MKSLTLLILIVSLNAAGQEIRIKNVNDERAGVLTAEDFYRKMQLNCHHIFVAVLPDTLVWDSKPVFTIDHTTGYVYPANPPVPQKIVCILCHKQTEQVIKIVNEQK